MKKSPFYTPFVPGFAGYLAACLVIAAAVTMPAQAAPSRINKSAQALAKHLAATPPAKKASDGDLAKTRQRMIAAIELVEANNRSNGPRPESLIENALDFREDMGDYERLLTMNAVISTWREANGRGLFDEKGKFQARITRGRGVGDSCFFERIVRAELLPSASNQLANLRLVTEEEKRPAGEEADPPDHLELAYRDQLEKMIAEKSGIRKLAAIDKGPETNALGQTEKQAQLLWEKEVEEAGGDLSELLPNIRLDGRITGTPSHMTKDRWRATAEVANLSNFPTEVHVDIYLIGITDRKRDHYLMAKSSQSLRLRRGESQSIEAYTRAQNSYKGKADDHDEVPKKERNRTKVRARGFVMVVRHGEKVVAFAGSDQRLSGYADPESNDSPLKSLPQF